MGKKIEKKSSKSEGKSVQKLLDKNKIKIQKTSEYEASDYNGSSSWTYKLLFDNISRKRKFLNAIKTSKPQYWDKWVKWFDEITRLNDEILVEANILVPKENVAKFRYDFEEFLTREVILKKED